MRKNVIDRGDDKKATQSHDKNWTVDVSADIIYLRVYMCHRLHNILTYEQNMPHHDREVVELEATKLPNWWPQYECTFECEMNVYFSYAGPTFVDETLLDSFKEYSGEYPVTFAEIKTKHSFFFFFFCRTSGHFQLFLWRPKQIFSALTQVLFFFCFFART